MRVLITSGGTRAAIDEVRWLGNLSTGRFGARLALACLARGAQVAHLRAEGAVDPFERRVDLAGDWRAELRSLQGEAERASGWRDRYRSESFVSPADYGERLEDLLRNEPFDVALLAAAVSDYAPQAEEGKISSERGELVVRLAPVTKFIAKVKDWAPGVYQVGFKLLAGVSQEALIRTALESGGKYRSDATVANDIRLVGADRHVIHVVREGKPTETYGAGHDAAERLAGRVLRWAAERSAT